LWSLSMPWTSSRQSEADTSTASKDGLGAIGVLREIGQPRGPRRAWGVIFTVTISTSADGLMGLAPQGSMPLRWRGAEGLEHEVVGVGIQPHTKSASNLTLRCNQWVR
jgi:hypothetical protein